MKIIDLSLELSHGLKTYTAHPALEFNESATFETTGHRYLPPCCGFETKFIGMSDHTGTHIDAPNHFIKGGHSVETIPLEKLIGSAILLDCSKKIPSEPVTAKMLEEAEEQQGIKVKAGDIVLIRAYDGAWGDSQFFQAEALSGCAARWLLNKNVVVVGVDLPNADSYIDMTRPVHMTLLSNNIYIIENLFNLDKLPRNTHFTFIATPLRLKGATASPIRAIGIIDFK